METETVKAAEEIKEVAELYKSEKAKQKEKKLTIVQELAHIVTQMCDHYCKWPEQWDAEEEGKELFESDICNHCPMQKLV